MHEIGLVAAAVARLRVATNEQELARVDVGIGPGVDPEVAAQAWAGAAARGPAARAQVVWVRRAHTLACFVCGTRYPGEDLSPCPACGGNGLVVVAAPDVEILDWTLARGTS